MLMDHPMHPGLHSPLASVVAWAVFSAGVGAAALWDVRQRRVPNQLNLGLAAAGVLVGLAHGGLVGSVAGIVVGLLLLVAPFARGWLGAGDVKLLAAVGAWLGPERTVYCALAAAVVGGVLALGLLARLGPGYRRAVATNLRLAVYTRSMPEVEQRTDDQCPPYAVAIGLGALATAALFGGPGVAA